MQYPVVLVLWLLASLASADSPVVDWSDVSRKAQQAHTPILVIFSAETCGYCVKLKREVLEPLSRDPLEAGQLLIRVFDINTGGKLTDFDGERIRSRQFKRRYGIFATPTLLILDPQGHPLTEPLVGYNSAEEYRELLHTSLVASFEALE